MNTGEPQSGDVIGERFELVEVLGFGGMGVVWRATQLNLGRDVALKLLLPAATQTAHGRERFQREARVASRLRHANAVQVYDFGKDGEQLFIAMELLEGHTLRSIVDVHLPPPPLERTLSILGQVADAVASAHAIHLVHRDLKPENVFLERDRAVVVDFGLAFISDPERPEAGRLTEEGLATGTPDYISPEQASGDSVGPPADVYSLGILLYEMLTARTPFEGTAIQVLTQQLFTAPTPVQEVNPGVRIPSAVADLCARAMAKRAADRPTMAQVRDALRGYDARTGDRARGRLEGREARMISTIQPARRVAPVADIYVSPGGSEPLRLAVVGSLEGDLGLGLGANGLLAYIVSESQPIEGADAIFAPGADAEALARLAEHGLPMVTDVEVGDLARVTRLLRAGVGEVVHRPVRAEDLASKVLKTIRRKKARSGE